MRKLAANEICHISGGEESSTTWVTYDSYDMDDVVDDISNFALLGIFINTYQTGYFTPNVVMDGATLGGAIGVAYSAFNYLGYKYLVN